MYIIIAILYQGFSPIILSHLGLDKTQLSRVEDVSPDACYILQMRLPEEIPLSITPEGTPNQTLTIWGWKSSKKECKHLPDETIKRIILKPKDNNLIFLNYYGREIPAPQIEVLVDKEEVIAPRYILQMRYLRTEQLPKKVSIQVTVDNTDKTISIPLQTPIEAGTLHILNIIFSTLFLTIVAGIGGITKFYFDYRESQRAQVRRSIQADIEKLDNEEVTQIGRLFLNLYNRLPDWGKRGELEARLRHTFQRIIQPHDEWKIWTYELRAQIATQLQQKQASLESFDIWLEEMSEGVGFPDDEQKEILKRFRRLVGSPERPLDYEDVLKLTIQAFQVLGLSAEETATEVVKQLALDATELRQRLQELWYREGKATGRYLLRRLNDPRVNEWLTEWNKNPSPPNPVKPHQRLWPPEVRYRLSENTGKSIEEYRKKYRQDSKSDPIWHWPFGPVKAEDDPRLPPKAPSHDDRPVAGLFWDGHPLWHRIDAPEPSIFVAKPGTGTTTFIWMGRHTRRFWGRKPALSLYLLLNGKPDANYLWHQAEHALGENLLTTLAEDPFWLLAAQRKAQEQIIAFLTHWAGAPSTVLGRLGEYGLPTQEQGLLLADVLYNAFAHRPYCREDWPYLLEAIRVSMEEAALSRLVPGERFHIFLWIELKSPPAPDGWLRILQEEGFWHLTVPKIFSPDTLPEDHLEVRWDQDDLRGLLEHRLSTCDWGEGEEGLKDFLMALEYSTKDTSTQALTTLGQSTPADLVRAGNELNR
ncbi:MAG: hypothetical protein GXP39_17550 [Chloroflexi bacterium]|nr:hypothetical protein [Chloroflexota bacterium]